MSTTIHGKRWRFTTQLCSVLCVHRLFSDPTPAFFLVAPRRRRVRFHAAGGAFSSCSSQSKLRESATNYFIVCDNG